MDRRTGFDTDLAEPYFDSASGSWRGRYKLFLVNDECSISVNGTNSAIQYDNGRPFVYIDLGANSQYSAFPNDLQGEDISLLANCPGGQVFSETKKINYHPLCDPPASSCDWGVELAPEERLDSNQREGATILFDAAELERVKQIITADTPSAGADRYYLLTTAVAKRVGGVWLLHTLDDYRSNQVYTVTHEPVQYDTTYDLWRSFLPTQVEPYDYLQILENGQPVGWRIVRDVSISTSPPGYAVGFFAEQQCKQAICHPDGYGYLVTDSSGLVARPVDSRHAALPAGTTFRRFRTADYLATATYAASGALAYRLGLKPSLLGISASAQEDEPLTFYRMARDFLMTDPMLGGEDAYSAHSYAGFGLAYDLIKDCLSDDACDPDYNQSEQIAINEGLRFKLATLMDHFTRYARQANVWKFATVANFTHYMLQSMGVIAQALADWEPAPGQAMTGPREWLDNALQLAHRTLDIDQFTLDGYENSGPMYAHTALSDVTRFAWIYYKVTGKNLIRSSRYKDVMRWYAAMRFGDGGAPNIAAVGYSNPFSVNLYANPLFEPEMNRLAKWMDSVDTRRSPYRGLNVFMSGLSIFILQDSDTVLPLAPPELESDPAFQSPSQFLPHANQAMFRDYWKLKASDPDSRQLFLSGKAEGIGNAIYGNFDLGNIIFYEHGEYLIAPDSQYWRPDTKYSNSNGLVDGFYSLSKDASNGELRHYFSRHANELTAGFIETAEIEAIFDSTMLDSTSDYTLRDQIAPGWMDYPSDYMSECRYGDSACRWNTSEEIAFSAEWLRSHYPRTAKHQRQVLYLPEYALIVDDMSASEPRKFELNFPTPRRSSEISIGDNGRSATWAGVRSDWWLCRHPNDPCYLSPEAASRLVRLYALNGNTWMLKDYYPESLNTNDLGYAGHQIGYLQGQADFALASVNQESHGDFSQFATLVWSKENHSATSWPNITTLSNVLGEPSVAVKLQSPSAVYEDTLIVNRTDEATVAADLNGTQLQFQGKLFLARQDGTGTVLRYYLRRPKSLALGGTTFYEGPDTVHHVSVSQSRDTPQKLRMNIEVDNGQEALVRLHAEFLPEHLTFKENINEYRFSDPGLQAVEREIPYSADFTTSTIEFLIPPIAHARQNGGIVEIEFSEQPLPSATPDPGGDLCPEDPDKAEPGSCGCGAPDTDSDQDGILDCQLLGFLKVNIQEARTLIRKIKADSGPKAQRRMRREFKRSVRLIQKIAKRLTPLYPGPASKRIESLASSMGRNLRGITKKGYETQFSASKGALKKTLAALARETATIQ